MVASTIKGARRLFVQGTFNYFRFFILIFFHYEVCFAEGPQVLTEGELRQSQAFIGSISEGLELRLTPIKYAKMNLGGWHISVHPTGGSCDLSGLANPPFHFNLLLELQAEPFISKETPLFDPKNRTIHFFKTCADATRARKDDEKMRLQPHWSEALYFQRNPNRGSVRFIVTDYRAKGEVLEWVKFRVQKSDF